MTAVSPDTIFALSSGRPPAGIAVVRISGPAAGDVLGRMASRVPEARRATLATIRNAAGEVLDRAMVLWMPGPATATGEDVAELHLHGGRAVVDSVLRSLATEPGLRSAVSGEFTRRAFENGRIDLNEAEGLADLLAAETDGQRRAALLKSGGAVSRLIEGWQQRLLAMSADVEAAIDHSEEEDAPADPLAQVVADAAVMIAEIRDMLARPPAERLRDGVRVVLAGPPNSGKSSLLNALVGRNAAIESDVPGTTRDIIEVPLAVAGVPFLFVDTAGLRDAQDAIEIAGIGKATEAMRTADLVLWLGDDEGPSIPSMVRLHARSDQRPPRPDRHCVSARTGAGMQRLLTEIVARSQELLPVEGEVTLTHRHRESIVQLVDCLERVFETMDIVVVAEHLRRALKTCDDLSGRAGVEQMLDDLFSRFCVGK